MKALHKSGRRVVLASYTKGARERLAGLLDDHGVKSRKLVDSWQEALGTKSGTALIVLYVFSPIDLVPDFIPGLGIVDDIVLVPLAIRWLLNRLPPELRAAASRRPR